MRKKTQKKGLLIINTGNGKGKTTAALGLALSTTYDMVILDEFTYASTLVYLAKDDVFAAIKELPQGLHLITTGRDADADLINLAEPGHRNAGDKTPLPARRKGGEGYRVLTPPQEGGRFFRRLS